jgi:hypothetical protein
MNPGNQGQSALSGSCADPDFAAGRVSCTLGPLSGGRGRRGGTTRGARAAHSFLDAIAGDPLLFDAGQALRPAHRYQVALGSSQLSLAFFLRLQELASRLLAPGVGR